MHLKIWQAVICGLGKCHNYLSTINNHLSRIWSGLIFVYADTVIMDMLILVSGISMQSDFVGIKRHHPSERPATPAQPRHSQRTAAPQKSRQPSSASSAPAHPRMSQACHCFILQNLHKQWHGNGSHDNRGPQRTEEVHLLNFESQFTQKIPYVHIIDKPSIHHFSYSEQFMGERSNQKAQSNISRVVQWILCLPSSITCLFIILLYFHTCQWADRHLLEVLLPAWLALVLEYFTWTFCSWKH